MPTTLRMLCCAAFVSLALCATTAMAADEEQGWTSLSDGKTFDGWKASENTDSWKIEDGAFVAQGPRSHLFYTGGNFQNFILEVDVMTEPGSNGGIFFHTKYQDEGWPRHGYESQVNNTHGDPVKTGSLYNTVKLFEAPAQDQKWWTQRITVRGNRVTVEIDGKQVIDYTEPEGKAGTVRLSEGTFAFQAHDPESVVRYKNVRVKPLPEQGK